MASLGPSLDRRYERGITRSKVRRTAIESCLNDRGLNPPGGLAAAGTNPLFDHRDVVPSADRLCSCREPGHTCTKDCDVHYQAPAFR